MKVTMLGCGTSVGVPALGRAGWGSCDPKDSRNRRQRCAVLVEVNGTTILVDAGPDIRNQLLPHQLKKIDAVLITHTHSDHVAGLDDLRAFYWPERNNIKIYATAHHGKDIVERFPYLFAKSLTRHLILFHQWRCIKLMLEHKLASESAKLIFCISITVTRRRLGLCLMTNLPIQRMSLI